MITNSFKGHVPPYPIPAPQTATQLITDNSDGSTAHSEDLSDDTGLLICQGIALIVFVVSLVIYACL